MFGTALCGDDGAAAEDSWDVIQAALLNWLLYISVVIVVVQYFFGKNSTDTD